MLIRLHSAYSYPAGPDTETQKLDMESHSVLIIGYDDIKREFDILDSWNAEEWKGSFRGIRKLSYETLPIVCVNATAEKVTRTSRIQSNVIVCSSENEGVNLELGFYAIPIELELDNTVCIEIIQIELRRKFQLLNEVKLTPLYKEIQQIDYYNSGSVLVELLLNQYNKKINQEEFRKIIDYVKAKSGWKDSDFQTWRLILKRALSSRACTLDEFIRYERDML